MNAQDHKTSYTGWHCYLVTLLKLVRNPEALTVLVRKTGSQGPLMMLPDLWFIEPYLADYGLLEYKSPGVTFTVRQLDRVLAYLMLCKEKYRLEDSQICGMLLYSHIAEGFFDAAWRRGLPFRTFTPGIRGCQNRLLKARRAFYYSVIAKELRKIMQIQPDMPGLADVTAEMEELRRQVLAQYTAQERLADLSPQELLQGLTPEQKEQLRRLLALK